MPILRAMESRILPGRRQQWLGLTKDLKKIVERHGVSLRVLELAFGGHPGTVVTASAHDDWEALAARTEQITSDSEYQAFLARVPQMPGFPFSEAVETRLASDITSEVGGAAAPLENARTFELMSMRVRPGKRGKLLEFIRQMREARAGAGLRVGNVLQTVAGDPSVMTVTRAYPDLGAWAKDRAANEPKGVQDVIRHAMSDPAYPYSDPIANRVFRDITSQL